MGDLWMMSGPVHGVMTHARWDESAGLVGDELLLEVVAALGRAGVEVEASPTGPFWTAGSDEPDQAYFSVLQVFDNAWDAVIVGDPPGWPWGVPEGATDR